MKNTRKGHVRRDVTPEDLLKLIFDEGKIGKRMKLGLSVFGAVFSLLFVSFFVAPLFFGSKVEVPPAHYGKILSKNGFQPGIIPPSKFRLAPCFFYCDALITVEASDEPLLETFRDDHALYMPKSELAMPFDVRGTFSIRNDEPALNSMFDRIPAASGKIDQSVIYTTYGAPIVRDVVRRIMAEYSIEEVASNRAKINDEMTIALNKSLQDTPLTIRHFGLGDVRFPKLVLDQKETAARRKIAIQQEEAEKQIRLVKLSADLAAAKAERAIRRERAEASLEENKIIAQSVTREYMEYRKLEALEKLAASPNSVFVPFDALSTVGLSNRIFNPSPSAPK